MKKTYSIKWKLMSVMILFEVSLLLLIYIFQVHLLDDFYRHNKINNMIDVVSKIESGIISNDLDTTINNVSLSNEVCVRIDTRGSVLTGFNRNNVCALEFLNNNQVNDIYIKTSSEGGSKLFENYQIKLGNKFIEDLYIAADIINYNGLEILVMVSSIVSPLGPTINTIKQQFFLIVFIVIVLSVILVLFISKSFIKPLTIINEQAKEIPIQNYDGNLVKTDIKEFSDINETLIESQKLIAQADKMRVELLSNVSHDLRTPLTMIVGYGEMMKDFDEEKTNDNLDVIVSEAKHLSSLVDDLLDLSKGELGKLSLNKSVISSQNLLNDIFKHYNNHFDSLNIETELLIEGDYLIDVDEKRIKQVLYNFINNAINYNDKLKPKIIIKSSIINRKLCISIYDNGQGIKEEDLKYIWDRYYKVDNEHSRKSLGSGIGLSLSKIILDEHGLEYGVKSEYGNYTEFYIYFDIIKSNMQS